MARYWNVLPEHDEHRKQRVKELNSEGFRVIAVAYRMFPGDNDTPHYTIQRRIGPDLARLHGFSRPAEGYQPVRHWSNCIHRV